MFFSKLFLASISLAITAFIFLNTYEVVFNKDVAWANAVQRFGAQDQLNAIIKQFDYRQVASREDSHSPPKRLVGLQIPALSSNLHLEEKRQIDGAWYVRKSMGHYLNLRKDSHGATADYLIYASSSWRTIADPNQIKIGMQVQLSYDDHAVSTFEVSEKQVLARQVAFVANSSKDHQIVLIIDDPNSSAYYGFLLIPKGLTQAWKI